MTNKFTSIEDFPASDEQKQELRDARIKISDALVGMSVDQGLNVIANIAAWIILCGEADDRQSMEIANLFSTHVRTCLAHNLLKREVHSVSGHA
jgi:hypothetical protein